MIVGIWSIIISIISAFGPRFSPHGIIDFALIIGEIACKYGDGPTSTRVFITSFVEQFSFRMPFLASGIHHFHLLSMMIKGSLSCQMDVNQTVIPKFSAWFISISLALVVMMRIAEALKSNGRYFRARYDITGCEFTPTQGTRPNGFKVMTGVHLWSEHFTYVFPVS